MKPIKFAGANVVLGANQPEYDPLPAMRSKNGAVTSCWRLSDEELLTIIATRCVYVTQLTFSNPLQPVHVSTVIEGNLHRG